MIPHMEIATRFHAPSAPSRPPPRSALQGAHPDAGTVSATAMTCRHNNHDRGARRSAKRGGRRGTASPSAVHLCGTAADSAVSKVSRTGAAVVRYAVGHRPRFLLLVALARPAGGRRAPSTRRRHWATRRQRARGAAGPRASPARGRTSSRRGTCRGCPRRPRTRRTTGCRSGSSVPPKRRRHCNCRTRSGSRGRGGWPPRPHGRRR